MVYCVRNDSETDGELPEIRVCVRFSAFSVFVHIYPKRGR